MPRQRFFNLSADARARLLGIALEEFARYGFVDASLNEILAKAGLSKGVYYYYFDDKEDLFATTLEHAVDASLARHPIPTFELATAKAFWATAEKGLRAWAESLKDAEPILRALRHVGHEQRHNPRFAALLARGQVFWRTLIAAGQSAGRVRKDLPVEVLVELVEAADHILDRNLLAAKTPVTPKVVAKHLALLLDTARRVLSIDDAGRAGGARSRTRA
jgi:AcrR family transcriptional regulator